MTVAVAGLAAAALVAPPGASAAAPARVVATITNSRIVLAPSVVPAGKVVITIVNRTSERRDFGLGARRTRAIAPGRSAQLTVTVSGSGERRFSSAAAPGSRRLTAALHLFVPCSDPAATTVDVQIDRAAGGVTLSSTTVPCGTVTFDVTDVDTPNADLLVAADAPRRSGVTRQVNPGQTATLTISFPAAAVARYSVVQVGGDGIIVAVGGGLLTVH